MHGQIHEASSIMFRDTCLLLCNGTQKLRSSRNIKEQVQRTVLEELVKINKRRYHTSHLCTGFIVEFLGQSNSFANSGKFESDPITLYLGGL